uniref:Uncharacterized protein n=1 Tax=Romanomermis culicivorax TaxID=13658 RepID=A0A915HU93_ROMCU
MTDEFPMNSTNFDDSTPLSVASRRSSSFKNGQNVDRHHPTSSSSGAARLTCNKTFNNYQYCRLQYGGSVKYYTRPPSRDPVPIKERISGRKGFLQQSQSNPLSHDDDGRQDGDGVAGEREATSSPGSELSLLRVNPKKETMLNYNGEGK